MTEPAKDKKKEEKKKYYFGIVPKEEFPKFMERLNAELKKTENKKGDKKAFEFEVRGTKEDLNGLSLEIFSFDKTKYNDFLDANKDKFQLFYRNKGKQVSFDICAKDGKLVQALMDLGIDLAEYHKFNFALKSGINLAEIFDPTADQTANFIKICSVIFSIKSETDNVKYLAGALSEALKDLKLEDPKKQAKFNKCVGFLNFINSFVGLKCKLEYDAKVMAGEGAKEAEKATGGADGLKMKITGTQQMAMGFCQSMLIPMITSFGMIDTVKKLNLDSISISLGVPKYQNGYAISLKIPGLSEVFGKMAAAPAPGK